ncbi:hypothetical protein M8C21_003611 [Ambrosia artemisiifolia]|uniref:glutathione transferase n=1 Tax=Ambrosia artemisiifolia TaxID=4212 RepID=A0AAD5DF63_AMBAR|nr:hypothetical protein M8C21_003611 [Ambrosia artemisiifolia]
MLLICCSSVTLFDDKDKWLWAEYLKKQYSVAHVKELMRTGRGLFVTESRAMTQYIANKYEGNGTDLILKDLIKLAIQMVWMDTKNQRFDPPFSKLIEATIEGKNSGQEVREYERKLESVLDVYEQRLKESKYLAGDFASPTRDALLEVHKG